MRNSLRHPIVAALVIASSLASGVAAPAMAAPADAAVIALNRTVSKFEFKAAPLSAVFESIAETTGANFDINWKALESVGVSQDMPVTINLRNLRVSKALDIILARVAGPQVLTYVPVDGVVTVTTRAVADQELILRVYSIEDLLLAPFYVGDTGNVTVSGGGGGDGNVFSNSGNSNNNDDKEERQKELAEKLVTLIRETVQPTIWREAGGPASIRLFDGRLVILAPRSVHVAIGGEFSSLSQSH